jgi:hypothetical protein
MMMAADTIPADHRNEFVDSPNITTKSKLIFALLMFKPAVRIVRADESSSKVLDINLSNFEISSWFSSALETKIRLNFEVSLLHTALLLGPTVHAKADMIVRTSAMN